MKKIFPAFLSVILLLIVEIINAYGNISIQQRDFELISNFLMILIAVTGLLGAELHSDSKAHNWVCIFSNVIVSAVAFPMNIDVFEHTIQLERLWSDLWGWHLWWIAFAIVQILVLSALGHNLLNQTREFLAWVKSIIKYVGSMISRLLNFLEQIDKGTLIVGLGIVLWGGYLYVQLYGNDMREILSDANFLWNNLEFWVAYLMIGILIYNSRSLFQNVWNAMGGAVSKANIKIAGIIMLVIVALIILPFVAPALWVLLRILIMLLTIPIMGYVVIKKISKRKRNQTHDSNMHDSDIYVVLFAFGMPLIIIFLLGALTTEGKQFFASSDLADVTAFLEFLKVVADMANSFMQLAGLK